NVPGPIAALTNDRTTTAFLDGDRGGDLILRELDQVADIDYVARPPDGMSVENLDRETALQSLRSKQPVEALGEKSVASQDDRDDNSTSSRAMTKGGVTTVETAKEVEEREGEWPSEKIDEKRDEGTEDHQTILQRHSREIIENNSGNARFLDEEGGALDTVDLEKLSEALEESSSSRYYIVLDGVIDQALLDDLLKTDIQEIIARERGELVKQPVNPRIRTADEILDANRSRS
ncbi:MAG: hypothetical protein ABEI52_08165, partial [Halobacteriaceae archaeon]